MTPSQINQVIAEACGDSKRSIKLNYHGSLDAMHEAEKTLKHTQTGDYQRKLAEVVDRESIFNFNLVCATAAQRAEAFIKTIAPEKWKEGE